MPSFVCVVPVCPVRNQASHRSEQVSQLLFGEYCEVIERSSDFVKIKMSYDAYEGWCQHNQLEETTFKEKAFNGKQLASDWLNELIIDKRIMRVPFGSSISQDKLVGRHEIDYRGSTVEVSKMTFTKDELRKISFNFLNTSYLWGGRSVFGIDCSGFTQLVFKFFQIPLLRDASQQASQGEEVKFLSDATFGDLAFFDNEAGKITHVGILLDATTIIHASGKVRVDTMDESGIYNNDTGQRTHQLRLIKRYKAS